ncbi:MAG TPA: hypothetical protein VGD98_08635 [Ktedonobacteraceae bacterium]
MSDELEKDSNLNKHKARPINQITVPLEWYVPDTVKNVYADNFIAQTRMRDFILSFFDTQIPPFSGKDEQNREYLEGLKFIRAECVGRITVAIEMVPDIIKALQTTYDRYLATARTEEEEKNDA